MSFAAYDAGGNWGYAKTPSDGAEKPEDAGSPRGQPSPGGSSAPCSSEPRGATFDDAMSVEAPNLADVDARALCARIRSRREALGISKGELARRLGRERRQITRWENGERVPEHASVLRIAAALDTPWQWFYEDDETPGE
jgi:DNA-binding transcriptional regulator YiaG